MTFVLINEPEMKKNIVIVDDFDNTRFIIEVSLRSIDAVILKASNGKEALAHFDGKTIDLLITDLNMPVMNGLELVKAVKDSPLYNTVPVIMLTTEKKPELKQEAQNLKITCWMQKPFEQEVFIKTVKRCLQMT